jgi:hypothetical protein
MEIRGGDNPMAAGQITNLVRCYPHLQSHFFSDVFCDPQRDRNFNLDYPF